MMSFRRITATAVACLLIASLLTTTVSAQKKRTPARKPSPAGPIVTRIDIDGLRSVIKPKGKPLLINFWATWCDPCREEFPDLVKIDADYKGKIDFVTVSLDDLADIKGDVPKFLREVKAMMPAYLLRTADEGAAIALVNKDWSGNLPMTVLIGTKGETAYVKSGKVKPEVLRGEIDKVLGQ